jgi:hypothetical protein
MNVLFFKGIDSFRMKKFIAVRSTLDNFNNVLEAVDIINNCYSSQMKGNENDFDIALFMGSNSRILVKKSDGYFSMSIPFQIVNNGGSVSFVCHQIEEDVSLFFTSLMRNAITTSKESSYSHEEIIFSLTDCFGINVSDAIRYYEAFSSLISDDHGYLRFDDDPDPSRMNGDIHPRYHFDIFFKNTSSIKIGYDKHADIHSFYSLFDSESATEYLGRNKLTDNLKR